MKARNSKASSKKQRRSTGKLAGAKPRSETVARAEPGSRGKKPRKPKPAVVQLEQRGYYKAKIIAQEMKVMPGLGFELFHPRFVLEVDRFGHGEPDIAYLYHGLPDPCRFGEEDPTNSILLLRSLLPRRWRHFVTHEGKLASELPGTDDDLWIQAVECGEGWDIATTALAGHMEELFKDLPVFVSFGSGVNPAGQQMILNIHARRDYHIETALRRGHWKAG